MGTVVTEAVSAVKAAIANSKTPSAPTAAEYWTSLHTSMLQYFPCDTPASTACAANVRNSQEAMVLQFAWNLSSVTANAQAATAFENAWPAVEQGALKQQLANVSTSAGIPSMINNVLVNYTYDSGTNPSGAAIVIATANTLSSVAAYVFTD
jgi:hypothetical protein